MSVSAEQRRFVQDKFAIGFWVDPPADEHMDRYYAEIAAANFVLAIGGFGARTPESVEQQIVLCEKYGLKAIVETVGLPPTAMPESPAVWGYKIRDEPSIEEFFGLRDEVDRIRLERPGRLPYINLFPNYATNEQLGTESYDDHVERFVQEVGIEVLCMDHYPQMRPDADGREGYCRNLEVMRKYSLAYGIPFWNFFNAMPFGSHYDPTEAQLRWQIYTSIAYGAKGVLYFCYFTPLGHEFSKGGAIITAEGQKTRHYEQAKRINLNLKNLGSTLMELTSTGVYRITPDDNPNQVLRGSPITNLTNGDYLIGVFKHVDGRLAVLLNNYSFAFTAWSTVKFNIPVNQVREVCKKTGREILVVDDSPAMEGLQISLDSGEGRLFLLYQ